MLLLFSGIIVTMLFVDDKGGDIYELINTAMIRNTMNDAINTAMIMPSLHHQEIQKHVLKFALCPELICYHVKKMQKLASIFQMYASCNSASQL